MDERKFEDNTQYPTISTERYYGKNSSSLHLPFFCAIRLPPGPNEIPIIPSLVAEACGMKIITGDESILPETCIYHLTKSNYYEGGMMGAVMGVGMGLFMGAMGDVSPIQIIQG
jgi:hypothetical protein